MTKIVDKLSKLSSEFDDLVNLGQKRLAHREKIAKDFETTTTVLDVGEPTSYKQYVPKPRVVPNREGIRITKDGIKQYYNANGKLHRLDGPAVISPDGNELWYRDGKLHRGNGPAALFHNGTQKWFMDGIELTPIEVLQLSLTSGKISTNDIETLKELAEVAFFDYAKTEVRALKQAGALLQEKGIIEGRNMHVIVKFLKASTKL